MMYSLTPGKALFECAQYEHKCAETPTLSTPPYPVPSLIGVVHLLIVIHLGRQVETAKVQRKLSVQKMLLTTIDSRH